MMEAVEQRMRELAVSNAELARRSQVSTKTIKKVRAGDGLGRVDVRRKLARGLGWSDDSLDRIERGEDPVEIAMHAEPVEDRLDRVERVLAQLVEEIKDLSARLPAP